MTFSGGSPPRQRSAAAPRRARAAAPHTQTSLAARSGISGPDYISRPLRSQPLDQDPTALIRAYPFVLPFFAKETPYFSEINPPSLVVQKYFQIRP